MRKQKIQQKPFNSDLDVAILGFHDGSAGQVSEWFEDVTGYKIKCYILQADSFELDIENENKNRVCQRTDFPSAGFFLGRPFIVSSDWINYLIKNGIQKVLPLTPNNAERLRQIEICQKHGIELVSAIHPTVVILSKAIVHPGVWINAQCTLGYKAEVLPGSIINTGVQIDHHNVLEDCCQIDPGVVTAGFVTLRKCCHVHTGATIINRIEIGEQAIVGAGSVVIKNIHPRTTVIGVPAREIKTKKP